MASEIKKGIEAGMSYSDFAVLYRTNTQSRTVEEGLERGEDPDTARQFADAPTA